MGRFDLAYIARPKNEIPRRALDKLELGHAIVANGMWRRRGFGKPRQVFAPVPAFRLESILQRIT